MTPLYYLCRSKYAAVWVFWISTQTLVIFLSDAMLSMITFISFLL